MNLPRRNFLHLAAGAAVLPTLSRVASAETYPSRPVHWIVSFAAGGPNDIVARIVGQYLSDHLGQQFVIENRTGAGGNVGMQSALSSAPDGYTIAFVGPNYAINPALYEKLPFDFIRDSVPVAGIMRLANVMEVNPALPANNVAEFIAYAKANPGKINFASGGVGTSPHLSGELLKTMAGINLVHVPYRGTAPALADLLAGQVQVVFDNIPGSIGHIKTGKVRVGRHRAETRGCDSRRANHWRNRAGLRGEHLVWDRGPQGHPSRDRRETTSRGECGIGRPEVASPSGRARRRADADDAG
jgi:tripartite-type tricarboxylate transporter receptor subunit TctC